jgi:RNA polymerase sigma-70 factor (ECF subfamily)
MSMENGAAQQPSSSGDGNTSGVAIDMAALVHAHYATVYGYAFRLCGDANDAEDVSQQVFLIAGRKSDQLRSAAKARSWLLTITRNCFLQEVKRRRPIAAARLDLEIEAVLAAPEAGSEVDTEEVQNALDELPDEYRVVVVMFYFEEASYKEIGEQLEIPVGTVMSRLSRAKSHLRRRLGRIGGDAIGGDAGGGPHRAKPAQRPIQQTP